MAGQGDPSFWNLIEEGGIAQSQTIHIEYINVRDGGAFADNLSWLVNLMTVECNYRCFAFCNVGTSFLLSGGSVTDLYNLNKHVGSVVETVGVHIRSRPVDLRHKFVLVPLVYNKLTCDRDFGDQEMASANGFNPVLGQSLSKFKEYNKLALEDEKNAYPNSFEELGDPNELLAVKTRTSTCTLYDREYITVKHSLRDGNNPRDSKQMSDRDRQSYFISLVKWVKNNYEKRLSLKWLPRAYRPRKSSAAESLATF